MDRRDLKAVFVLVVSSAIVCPCGTVTVITRVQGQPATPQTTVQAPPASARPTSPRTPRTPPEELARLRAYHDRLRATIRTLPRSVSLAAILSPVLQLASTRGADGSLPDEVRAAFVVVAFYVNGWGLDRVVAEARPWPRLESRTVLLCGRDDLSKHFALSALIAASAGATLAQLAGVFKELDDARHGSGFSFADLAADRAGTKLGQLTTVSAASGRLVLARIGRTLTEDDIMPTIEGLPDGLSQADFIRLYGGIGAAAYNEMVSEIDRRLATLTVFR